MTPGSVTAFAPARVNLVGEHTDYNGGLALPFAIDRGVTVRATTLPGPLIMARAADLGETDTFDAWRPDRDVTGWRAFVRGTVAELAAEGYPVCAARLEITGAARGNGGGAGRDGGAPPPGAGALPRGAGLASSAALGCALALALLALAGVEDPDRRALAALCSRVENEWVGARTGVLDQYASLLAREGEALRIDFAYDTIDAVPLDLGDWRLAVVGAGARTNAGSAYNDRRRECGEASDQLGVHTLRWAERDAAEALDEPWRSRALHVIDENARVEAAADALRSGDIAALGPLLDASHASLRDGFDVSTPEVEAIRDRLDVAGSRLIGGGFGGHLLVLVRPGAQIPRGAVDVRPCPGARVR
jgi:galactokinase